MAEREAARLEEEARREQEELHRQEAQRLEREKVRAELRAHREHQRTEQAILPTAEAKPRWGTPEARLEARMELQRRIEKSRGRVGKKDQG
jgi:hypothetical protein